MSLKVHYACTTRGTVLVAMSMGRGDAGTRLYSEEEPGPGVSPAGWELKGAE